MNLKEQLNSKANIDVAKFTVAVTDLRNNETQTVEMYRHEGNASRDGIIAGLARIGYRVDSIVTEFVTCPIDWERVYNFFDAQKGSQDERLEQTAEG